MRKKNKWTQQRLSNLTGIPRNTLGEIEIHLRDIHEDQITALCKAFDLDGREKLFERL
ncbi:helix-turn-helix domain-containing protein [Sporomusa aerivorans]|uniref:helix-turn-helix domain-containing protein n=1 Tax=Sporomusa aerivorans TaxID=204936 RepID=UPI00352B9A71